jgi:hypothetical protein
MKETNPAIKSSDRKSNNLRVVHSPNRKEADNNRAKTVSGEPGLTTPRPKHHYSRAYSPDAVGGNYQGL